jgi:DNA replication protein DnaC
MRWYRKKEKNEFDGDIRGHTHCWVNEAALITEKTQEEKIQELETRVKQMECEHGGWEYCKELEEYPLMNVWGGYEFFTHSKKCTKCGKVVGNIPKEQWLQEQADLHYEKHIYFIGQINELNEEEEV